MRKIANKIKRIVNNIIPNENICISELKNKSYIIYVDFELTTKSRNAFKLKVLPKIKHISEKNNSYLIYKHCKKNKYNDFDFTEIYIKDKNKTKAELKDELFHISPSRNRKKILEEGLIPQPFETSRWKDNLNYYYEPAIFCAKSKELVDFLYYSDYYSKKQKFDVWKVDLTKVNNNWFVDTNMGFDGSFLTHEKINPEHLSLVETY